MPVVLSLLAVPALTASNGVPPVSAGAGSGAVTGFAVSDIHYSLGGDVIDRVSFDLSPPKARTVKVRLAPGEPWTTCVVSGGTATCPVSTPAASVEALDVVAAS